MQQSREWISEPNTSRLVRQAELIAHATDALDGKENGMRWLQRPHPSLSGKSPLEVIYTGDAADLQLVDELLSAVEYGIYV